jgi:hypothetical protein
VGNIDHVLQEATLKPMSQCWQTLPDIRRLDWRHISDAMYLRYAIPWHPVAEVLDWPRGPARAHPDGVTVHGADGEESGLWPDTGNHCGGKGGWVDRFFAALDENARRSQMRSLLCAFRCRT